MTQITAQIRRPLSLAALLLGALACLACFAGRADAYIYWTDLGTWGSGDIGRANLDYSGKDRHFVDGGIGPSGIAIDDRHLYWINVDGDSIGRARLDGHKVDQHFIDGIGFALDIDVQGGYLYWSRGETLDSDAGIARASLDGSQVDLDYVDFGGSPDYTAPTGLDVTADHIYWVNAYPSTSVARANLDGTGVDQTFIVDAGIDLPFGLAVTDEAIYWCNRGTRSIARAPVGGGPVQLEFIPKAGYAPSVAVDDRFVYWPGPRYSLLRARLDGGGRKVLSEHRFHADSIAIDALGPG